jgi:hypothetical protein
MGAAATRQLSMVCMLQLHLLAGAHMFTVLQAVVGGDWVLGRVAHQQQRSMVQHCFRVCADDLGWCDLAYCHKWAAHEPSCHAPGVGIWHCIILNDTVAPPYMPVKQ